MRTTTDIVDQAPLMERKLQAVKREVASSKRTALLCVFIACLFCFVNFAIVFVATEYSKDTYVQASALVDKRSAKVVSVCEHEEHLQNALSADGLLGVRWISSEKADGEVYRHRVDGLDKWPCNEGTKFCTEGHQYFFTTSTGAVFAGSVKDGQSVFTEVAGAEREGIEQTAFHRSLLAESDSDSSSDLSSDGASEESDQPKSALDSDYSTPMVAVASGYISKPLMEFVPAALPDFEAYSGCKNNEGYELSKGWYDVTDQGVCNDFCGWSDSDCTVAVWSCHLAGAARSVMKDAVTFCEEADRASEGGTNARTELHSRCSAPGVVSYGFVLEPVVRALSPPPPSPPPMPPP
eukprot:CAMPEP_0197843926 /NCGR_PEP_ID=MMETSP1438-20131217/903_1 /TAXON_ID=1461541 /ORGANISM="Pterosperma sp., Strain CCMP1384" /LENGTH=350 /DNA_ID=CAMNT_0043454403 /DNA_START=26 /DNA_END=1074 /DNA_ORIENTATION=+